MTSIHSHRIQFQSTNDTGGLQAETLNRSMQASKGERELARCQVILGQRISSFYQNAELQNEPHFSSWKVVRGRGGGEEEGRRRGTVGPNSHAKIDFLPCPNSYFRGFYSSRITRSEFTTEDHNETTRWLT